jgi:inhibitor of cysteine peptidase
MKRTLRLLAIVPLAFMLGACGAGAQGPRQIGEADAGTTIQLRAGEQLRIALSGNPTTGYSWELASTDEKVLKSLGQPEYKSGSQALGAGGMFTFTLQAVAPGTTAVQLVYRRPFEKNVAPAKTFEVKAVVQ